MLVAGTGIGHSIDVTITTIMAIVMSMDDSLTMRRRRPFVTLRVEPFYIVSFFISVGCPSPLQKSSVPSDVYVCLRSQPVTGFLYTVCSIPKSECDVYTCVRSAGVTQVVTQLLSIWKKQMVE